MGKRESKVGKIKKYLIRKLGLRGSWAWAKRQMMNGEIVRCKHWSGALKYRVSPEIEYGIDGKTPKPSTLLQANFTRTNKPTKNGSPLWETSNHHLSYENFTDYEIFNW